MMKLCSLVDNLSATTAYLSCRQCRGKTGSEKTGKNSKAICSGLSLALVLCLSTAAQALKADNTPLQDQLKIRPSVDDIARQINQQPKWRVLEAGPTVEGKKTVYRFKLLDKERGSVKVFIIDPADPLFKNLHLGNP